MKKFLNILGNLEELAVGGLLLLLAVGTTIQVLTRYFLGLTFDWFDEGSRYLVVFATFAGAGMAVKHGAHFSMEAVTQYAPKRVGAGLRALANLLSAAVMLVIAWFGWEQTALLARYGMTMAALGLPMWVAYLPIPLFGVGIAARFGFKAWEQLRIALAGEAGEGV
ncbi:TRAP transporter small permease [Desulfomicrobium salsuginis]